MIRRFQPVIEERIAGGPEQYQSEKDKYFQGAWSGDSFKNKVRAMRAAAEYEVFRPGRQPPIVTACGVVTVADHIHTHTHTHVFSCELYLFSRVHSLSLVFRSIF